MLSFNNLLNLMPRQYVKNNLQQIYGSFINRNYAQASQWTNLMFKNPSYELQQYLEVPLNVEKLEYFNPTPKFIESSLKLFVPHNGHDISLISRTAEPKHFPSHSIPEIALLGQSNAGKSTLLKAVFDQAPDVQKRIRTSKTPGSTKCLSFYQVGECFCLVDMPGYGYRQPEWFQSSVMHYLKNRKNLLKTFLLIDCKRNFNKWDDAAIQMAKDLNRPFAIILTKIDAVPDSVRLKNLLFIQKMVLDKEVTCFPQIFMLSSLSCEGLAYFLAFVTHITGALNNISNLQDLNL